MRAPISLFRALARKTAFLACVSILSATPVQVRHPEGLIHGFLVLRDMQNKILASGDLIQVSHGNRVTAELVFHFLDGSLHDETAIYSQRQIFHLISYHLVQKGKAFEHPIDLSLNVSKGEATVHATEQDGKEKTYTEHLTLPDDLANGIVNTVLLDIDANAPKTTLSMVVATPKPRLVKLEVTPSGEDTFSVGGVPRKARTYSIKVNLGGLVGLIAPLINKQPEDLHVWISSGKVPGFLRLEGQLAMDGPVWRIELASPVWAEK